ncbi:hypothetical protein B0H14DRAFT_2802242 [Mycena olivaceomarginata]|nr:hypothetical protein B0H14DRAFT_2802242 [Mycena olivaceomarginata]
MQSIFGQPAPALCAQQNQQQRPGLFGGAPSSSNKFGASAPNANGALKSVPVFGISFGLGLGGQQQQQQQPNNAFGASTLSTSALRPPGTYIFYNRVDPVQVGLYGRPPNTTNNALWARAVRENPDPGCLVPAITVGFDDLRQRMDAQGTQAGAHQEKLKELKTRLAARHHADAAHASTAGAREPPAPARARAALVGHPRRGGTARVAGGGTGAGGRARGWRRQMRGKLGHRAERGWWCGVEGRG